MARSDARSFNRYCYLFTRKYFFVDLNLAVKSFFKIRRISCAIFGTINCYLNTKPTFFRKVFDKIYLLSVAPP